MITHTYSYINHGCSHTYRNEFGISSVFVKFHCFSSCKFTAFNIFFTLIFIRVLSRLMIIPGHSAELAFMQKHVHITCIRKWYVDVSWTNLLLVLAFPYLVPFPFSLIMRALPYVGMWQSDLFLSRIWTRGKSVSTTCNFYTWRLYNQLPIAMFSLFESCIKVLHAYKYFCSLIARRDVTLEFVNKPRQLLPKLLLVEAKEINRVSHAIYFLPIEFNNYKARRNSEVLSS